MVTTANDQPRSQLERQKLSDCIGALDEIIAALAACCTPEQPCDIDELHAWAERRTAAVETAARLEGAAIDAIIQLSGTRDAPLLRLCASDPAAAAEIRGRLHRIGELRSALSLVDERRRELIERARRMVRGYTAALFPTTQAYGRKPAPVHLPQLRGVHA